MVKIKNDLTTDRLIIGSGVAGTAVYAELPIHLREKHTNTLPDVLVIADTHNPNQWIKDGHTLMGQDRNVLIPSFMTEKHQIISPRARTERNPYVYVMADDFNRTLLGTKAELRMPILDSKANKIESYDEDKPQNDWLYPNFKHRVEVTSNHTTKYIYTNHIDICTGPGVTRALTDKQIDPKLAAQLVQQKKLIYGQDNSDAKLEGDVVFYGGGARNAAMVGDIIYGYHKNAKVKHWVAYNSKNFKDLKPMNRMFNDICENKNSNLATGNLLAVKLLQNGKLELTFEAPKDKKDDLAKPLTDSFIKIECDQLVVSIGQEPNKLTDALKDFHVCYLEEKCGDFSTKIPLGTCSKDGSIIAWGAAGGSGVGLDRSARVKLRQDIETHSLTLPRESQAFVGIYFSSWGIEKMAQTLRNKNAFPALKSPQDNVHYFDLPEINTATRVELMEVLNPHCTSFKECNKYVNEILKIRAKNALGIANLAILKDHIPYNLIKILHNKYFPYSSEFVISDEVKEEPTFTSNKSTLFQQKNASSSKFLRDVSRIPLNDPNSEITFEIIPRPNTNQLEKPATISQTPNAIVKPPG